ncbi:type-2 proteasome subunit alpha [Encephalitozoon hellem]|uniref:Proteasome subunit n=1 Tax=Encephalitozoon hellem TaxID=27973 RepID=A0A9Q9C994_ENCHE|nr:type-2 proteasome subunit alpha [Encephalitozoon hellem ATCC 50504]AFM98855.1 type-2 proteasome subunit alpha [Encephalitozoon hellem ATCC 50504]KAG5860584.1 type-2 proteasome subunit alpha [Encephalitozoon hellem]UTX43835.1 proteasome subunit alpha type-1 [Encephalitozoon hellem]WEL39313.1 proteasome subunit [Encephalitozoon hellem]|eukprot:XP_003887836.1 type-2 proteasome subunit alpha [Encephalitozoon hellem ATCC 50504]
MDFGREKPVTLFSSEGNLGQCDNALRAAVNGSLSIGASAADGAVLMSFKDVPSLVIKEEVRKVFKICDTIGCTYSGLQPDCRLQVNIGCQIAEEYYDVYGRYPDVDVFISHFSSVVQEYTQKSGYRPFGTLMIFAGPVKGVPRLYQVDPSGSYQTADVCTSGTGYSEAKKFIKRRLESLDDNIVNCVSSMREFAGKEVGPEDIDIGVYYKTKNVFKTFTLGEVREVFDSLSKS